MKTFFEVVDALKSGEDVRMIRWEAITRMFIQGDKLVCQRGDGEPYAYNPSWWEMEAKQWSVIETAPSV